MKEISALPRRLSPTWLAKQTLAPGALREAAAKTRKEAPVYSVGRGFEDLQDGAGRPEEVWAH